MTVREPEFTAGETALLLASKRYAADFNQYGFTHAEATDPANQFAFKGQEKPRVDYVAKADQDAQDVFYRAHPDVSKNGHRWGRVTRRDATE